jgi:hypothetical protein
MQYATKLKVYPSNPAYDCVFNPLYENVYDKQPNTIQPFENSDINLDDTFNLVAYCIPSLIRLFSREGSFASTYKLSTGDVLNAPSESRNP